MPETSGWPAALLANPIGSLMFAANIWQCLSSLIHHTWQNLAIWPLPCSVSILKIHFEKCQRSWLESIRRKVEAKRNSVSSNQAVASKLCFPAEYLCLHHSLRWHWSLAHLLFLTCHWQFILGVIGTSSLLISAALMQGKKAAGTTDCTPHTPLPFKAEKWHSLDCRRWPGWLPL